jgi:hypothetical protein
LEASVNTRTSRRSRDEEPNDVGTLWTMRRLGRRARCALLAWPGDWEIRVLIDDQPLLSERCGRAENAFAVAETWKRRMREDGWHQVIPNPRRTLSDGRPPAEIAPLRTR